MRHRFGPRRGLVATCRVWWWLAVLVGSGGCLFAAVLAARPALLLSVVVPFGLAFTVDQSTDVRDQVDSGLWSGFLACGAVGWLALFGLAVLPLVLVGGAALWPAHWVLRGVLSGRPGKHRPAAAQAGRAPRGAAPAAEQPNERADRRHPHESFRLHGMSTDHLCRAWSDSRVPLKLSDGPAQVERTARLRAAILDELESRHPDGVARWLADLREGRRVDASPLPYLSGQEG